MKKRWFTPSFEESTKNNASRKRRITATNSDNMSKKMLSRDLESVSEHLNVLDKYQPLTVDDLVIHPKKIKEVEMWLRDCFSTDLNDRKYLLLSGPSGCGKTVTYRLLAKSLNVNVIEWITPLDRDSVVTDPWSEINYCIRNAGSYELFEHFLRHASRYNSLMSPSSQKSVVIKDFPPSFIKNPDPFHDLIKKYYNLKTCPIIFICNDKSTCRTLFPDHIRNECAIHSITFNPVNCTAVVKALKRVAELQCYSNQNFNALSLADLRNLAEETCGDLRSALLKLYFNTIKPVEVKHITSPGSSAYDANNGHTNDHIKDQIADLFILLGRVLYSKRKYNNPLASCLQLDDYKFVHDSEEIVKAISFQPFLYIGFLQENYVSRFSCLNSIALAADKFSRTDIMMRQPCQDLETVALTFIIRSLMVVNENPKKSFAPFTKPKFYNEGSKADLSRLVRNSFPLYRLPLAELVMHVLPVLRTNFSSSFRFNETQNKFIRELTCFFFNPIED